MTGKPHKVEKRLDDWLQKCRDSDFPFGKGIDYKSRYVQIAEYLNNNVHGETEKGALVDSALKGLCGFEQLLYLNKHGKGHVEKVIEKASELLKASDCYITPYEGYILLFAIQLHDTGNIFGRTEHEKRCSDIMELLGELAGTDTAEKRIIVKISSVHGGLSNSSSTPTNLFFCKINDL